jgi:hypothetical protein
MPLRVWFILLIGVLSLTLGVALGYCIGLGWLVLIMCLRYILLLSPMFRKYIRKNLVAFFQPEQLPQSIEEGLTRRWHWMIFVCVLITLITFIWINIPLKDLF